MSPRANCKCARTLEPRGESGSSAKIFSAHLSAFVMYSSSLPPAAPDVDGLKVGLTEPLVEQGVVADQREPGLQMADGLVHAAGQKAPDLSPSAEVALLGANVGDGPLGELLGLARRETGSRERPRSIATHAPGCRTRRPTYPANLSAQTWTSSGAVHQPRRDPEVVRRAPHAAFEHVPAVEIATDLREASRIALETHRRGPGDHAQRPNPRQIGDDLVGEPVREVLGIGIRAQIRKRKDDDRLRFGRFFLRGHVPLVRTRARGGRGN